MTLLHLHRSASYSMLGDPWLRAEADFSSVQTYCVLITLWSQTHSILHKRDAGETDPNEIADWENETHNRCLLYAYAVANALRDFRVSYGLSRSIFFARVIKSAVSEADTVAVKRSLARSTSRAPRQPLLFCYVIYSHLQSMREKLWTSMACSGSSRIQSKTRTQRPRKSSGACSPLARK